MEAVVVDYVDAVYWFTIAFTFRTRESMTSGRTLWFIFLAATSAYLWSAVRGEHLVFAANRTGFILLNAYAENHREDLKEAYYDGGFVIVLLYLTMFAWVDVISNRWTIWFAMIEFATLGGEIFLLLATKKV